MQDLHHRSCSWQGSISCDDPRPLLNSYKGAPQVAKWKTPAEASFERIQKAKRGREKVQFEREKKEGKRSSSAP